MTVTKAGTESAVRARESLPALRAELQLMVGAPNADGEPAWMIHDPLLNRFIQLDVAAYETLRHYRDCTTPGELIAHVNAAGRVAIDVRSLDQLLHFIDANRLTADPSRDGWRRLAGIEAAGRRSALSSILHSYLFFRVPLCRPQAFLERTLPFVRPLSSRPALWTFWLAGLLGLYLASRQWNEYLASFQGFFTWEGLLLSVVALALVKAAHELGHAYVATAFGCRVHTMGVAFMMMAPLLYTDVTDSWRLRDRRKRLLIDGAGILVELAIAAIAIFLWAFLPDGPLRGLAFVLSAVSMLSSLAINLNPFMRFDGYYLLSEAIGVDNLQPRAFALGRWQAREVLFGLGEPPPESLPKPLTRMLVVYAWATWIYRLVLFIGIALLVYHYFFKALGIFLFAVEIGYFLVKPAVDEITVWYRNRHRIRRSRRTVLTATACASALLLLLVPWSTRVEIPAVVEGAQLQPLHALRAARITGVHVAHGAEVKAGDPIVTIESPDIEQELGVLRTKLAVARLQHGRRAADSEDRANSLVLESAMNSLAERIEGLERERREMILRAPFDGRVVEMETSIQPGRWINPREQIALVVANQNVVAKGYVSENDLWRIAPGVAAKFIPENTLRPAIDFKVAEIAASGSQAIEIADLASTNMGRIAVNQDAKRRLIPTTAQYMVHLDATSKARPSELRVRGVVLAEGRPESLLARGWRQTLKVLLRESGA